MICSAFLDNVTTVLLTVPITFSITAQLKVDVKPYLISQILASNIGGTPKWIVPALPTQKRIISCLASSASCMMRRAWIRKARPASVKVTCFWLRSISVRPSSASSALMAFVTDGCETCRTFAVRVKFSSSLIVQKYSN